MHRLTVVVALLGILNPYTAFAQTNLAPVKMIDIQLDGQGHMNGQIVNGSGVPQPGAKISLSRLRQTQEYVEPVEIQANADGKFQTVALQAGTYRLTTRHGAVFVRCWQFAAAPPAAAKALLVVDDAKVARGQQPISQLFYSEPLLMAALVTAAIAIPIAVHKSRDDAPEGS